MNASQRAFLEGIIDYAGLFPPAQLPLEEAIRNYARYRSSPEAWLLARFVCPVARLTELAPLAKELFSPAQPLRLSVLTTGGVDVDEALKTLDGDIAALQTFRRACAGSVVIEALETKIPQKLITEEVADIGKLVLFGSEKLDERLGIPLTPWYEPVRTPGRGNALLQAALGVGGANRAALDVGLVYVHPAGLKLRCGGADVAAIPAPSELATILAMSPVGLVGLKATAGLHHPFRRFDAALQAHTHGFVNLFGAAILAHTSWLPEEKIIAVLEDEDPSHFTFDDAGLRWEEYFAPSAAIRKLRTDMVTSLGSCSFEEPVADLRTLGWL